MSAIAVASSCTVWASISERPWCWDCRLRAGAFPMKGAHAAVAGAGRSASLRKRARSYKAERSSPFILSFSPRGKERLKHPFPCGKGRSLDSLSHRIRLRTRDLKWQARQGACWGKVAVRGKSPNALHADIQPGEKLVQPMLRVFGMRIRPRFSVSSSP